MESMMLKRRDALKLATSAVAGSALGAAGAMAADGQGGPSLAAAIRAAYGDASASRALGMKWLEQQPASPSAATLEAALRARGAQAGTPVDGLADAALRRWVTNRIREDFASGHVEDVGGSRLARTEVLVFALMTIG